MSIINPKSITTSADADNAFNLFAITQIESTPSKLSLNMDDTTNNIKLDSGAGYKVNDLIIIDNEVILVTTKTGRDLVGSRAQLGTLATNHGKDMPVGILKYGSMADWLRQNCIEDIKNMVAQFLPDADAEIAAAVTAKNNRLVVSAQ